VKNILRAALLAVGLFAVAGCTAVDRVTTAYDVLTTAKVSRSAVVIARSTFDALEVTATNYLRLKRCDGSSAICRDPSISRTVIAAVRSGRVARDGLTVYFRSHPGELGPSGLYDALVAANNTLQASLATYQANR
jgi:hypothetical protein